MSQTDARTTNHKTGEGQAASRVRASVPALLADVASKVLAVKEGETFLYSDVEGNLDDRKEYGLGLYHRDTRFLSHFIMKLSGRDPILLSSSAERGYMSYIDLTNPELYADGHVAVGQQTLNIRRVRAINGRVFERIRIKNYNAYPVELTVQFSLAADFADIFEVRGLSQGLPGHYEAPWVDRRQARFAYKGEDGVLRETLIELDPEPERLEVVGDRIEIEFLVRLAPHQTKLISTTFEPVVDGVRPPDIEFDGAIHRLRRSYEDWERESTQIITDNELFNQLLTRGLRDLRALYHATEDGGVFAAGIPWYVAIFGRDSLIAAHQLLAVNSGPARQALRLLARYQGTEDNPWRDEEPGKILHEVRQGELAGAGEIPHQRYFGTVDATPLFIFLYAQYFRWTGDVEFALELLPNVLAALEWIEKWGDVDGDGFVEYRSRSPRGIDNQGWKDSYDSVVHADGRLADPPIALAEVQGYVYMAKERLADVFEILGDRVTANRLRTEAEGLKARFNQAFWMDDERFFAGALDGEKRPVKTIVSNPGHCLYANIVDPTKAEDVARRLLQPDMFSGWGIRTMSKGATPYNPMSYHNGTVWPHDNALIAAGLKRYGFLKATNRVATAIFDAAIHADYMRLPELFCGFTRRAPNQPVAYPVACSPQAWAAGSPFLMLQAILGLSARGHENMLTVNKPHLPPWLNVVELRNLRVGGSTTSLVFRRQGEITAFSLLERKGDVRVVMEE
ncbi:MAG TPA: amylo-alpha-1,6-glucosidase [Actinomycetota bacterium]|nr:amylo-alpha-1,6-glucosidase [Actinomycetota bacterium]